MTEKTIKLHIDGGNGGAVTLSDLAAFLTARLDDDEQRLHLQDDHLSGHDRPYNLDDPTDPARVLRDLDAKRRLIAELDSYGGPETEDAYHVVLRHLALPYSRHPEYPPEWAP